MSIGILKFFYFFLFFLFFILFRQLIQHIVDFFHGFSQFIKGIWHGSVLIAELEHFIMERTLPFTLHRQLLRTFCTGSLKISPPACTPALANSYSYSMLCSSLSFTSVL